MREVLSLFWRRLRVQQKVFVILLVVFVPVVSALAWHASIINDLLEKQAQHRQLATARKQVLILRRIAVDIEDAFRGFLLTRQEIFLIPLEEAEPKFEPAATQAAELVLGTPGLAQDIRDTAKRLESLLESKHVLISQVRAGHGDKVLAYVSSGQGIALSDRLREDFRRIQDRLDQRIHELDEEQESLAKRVFTGLLLAVFGGLGLGLVVARLLAKSITGPLETLQMSVAALGREQASGHVPQKIAIGSFDEIGQLARAYEDMAGRIRQQVRELEAIIAVGGAINALASDGLDGVLRRITDHAVELLQTDVCLVLIRDERMGCWVVEAASGQWHDRLHKSVLLWEELPVSVKAFETKEPACGDDMRLDFRPEVVRRNLIGESMLAMPLLSQGVPFGVLALLREQKAPGHTWNLRLARGFADAAAIAICNARLYETAHQKERGLEIRLRRLEQQAEMLAHDLKAPGERMEGMASLLLAEYGARLDERAARWLRMIKQNGKDLTQRVDGILAVARVGSRAEAVEAVDPAWVIEGVLKARAGEIEEGRITVEVERGLPLIAGHRAYVRQVFDNLISNAIKFSAKSPAPAITIRGRREGEQVQFRISDNGLGIPANQRERAFEPFVRLTPDAAGGSGIGLTIVRRIVEMYGGRIWVEPNEGSGCTISLTLPMLGELTREREEEPPPSAQMIEPLPLPSPQAGTADGAKREGSIEEEMPQ